MWIARDKDDDLGLFTHLPKRCKDYGGSWEAADCEDSEYCGINKKLFPEFKWEDDPVEVDIIPSDSRKKLLLDIKSNIESGKYGDDLWKLFADLLEMCL